ncbi:condensation domain-containing protein [Pedobacter sp. MR22-3]|uniref:condensation domain-containing protein n=1 Tax=Pedobacter TaxID=84567 RepID=UPI002245F253|nr:condensation domain-containing protein [Pedobacter sp. MR22-3]MCX2584725.1 condensation domain-containing protein [Pedobacter sp. MR22-3]
MDKLYGATSEQIQSWIYYTMYPTHINHQVIILETTLVGLDLPALNNAIEYLVIRHESLRTYFVEIEDTLKQCIVPFDRNVFMPVYFDISALHSAEDYIDEVKEETKVKLSNLSKPPLMYCTIFKITDIKYQICFMIHHIISDEWSKMILHKELGMFYELFRKGEKVDLPPLEMQLKDYASWQRSWFEENGESASNYWSEKLSSRLRPNPDKLIQHYKPLLNLSIGTHHNEKIYSSVENIKNVLDTQKSACCNSYIHGQKYMALNQYCRSEGVSIGAALNASFQILFYSMIGKSEILLTMPVVNRFLEATQSIIGGLGGGIYLMQPIQPEMQANDFIKAVYIEFLKSAGTLIFDHVEMKLDGNILRLLTDLYVNFMNKSVTSKEKIKITAKESHAILNDPEFYGISCIITEYKDGLFMQWKYNVALYSAAFVDKLIKKHLLQLDKIILNPNITINNL